MLPLPFSRSLSVGWVVEVNRRLSSCLAWLSLGLAVLVGGCRTHLAELQGEGFDDQLSGWSSRLRPEQSDGTPLGASRKALEVERNLGFR